MESTTEGVSASYEAFMALQRRVAETAVAGKPVLAAGASDDEAWGIFVCGYGGMELDPQWSPIQRTGHFAFRFQSLADSGGISGYLDDVHAHDAEEVIAALETVGAAEYAAMFRTVLPYWEALVALPADVDPEARQDAEDYVLTHDEYLDTEPPLATYVRAFVLANRAAIFHTP